MKMFLTAMVLGSFFVLVSFAQADYSVCPYDFPYVNGPTATTLSAEKIESNSVVLTVQVVTRGLETRVWFKWGFSVDNLNYKTIEQSVGCGKAFVDISQLVENKFTPNTTYYYQIAAENNKGYDEGKIFIFKTLVSSESPANSCFSPLVSTKPAISITYNSATFQAKVNPKNHKTEVWFEYGKTSFLGAQTSKLQLGVSSYDFDVTRHLTAFHSNTTYYYRVVAKNDCGSQVEGDIRSFTTDSVVLPIAPTPTPTPTPIPIPTLTLPASTVDISDETTKDSNKDSDDKDNKEELDPEDLAASVGLFCVNESLVVYMLLFFLVLLIFSTVYFYHKLSKTPRPLDQ